MRVGHKGPPLAFVCIDSGLTKELGDKLTTLCHPFGRE